MSDPRLPSALLRRLESVIAPLEALRARALAMEAEFAGDLAEVAPSRRESARNLLHSLCEAAHVPVIWATQVLESMAKKGMPSRAEVSDAAMSVEAECVMLNKGPYVVDTVRFLSGVLERMSAHTSKRQSMLRRLSVSQSLARAHARD